MSLTLQRAHVDVERIAALLLFGMTQIAFLGTGLLGSAMVEAAAPRGERITVWNRTADKANALAPLGVEVARTPAESVRDASRVHLVLRDDAVVDEVIEALLPELAADAIILDHTTTQPKLTLARAARLSSIGVQYLHCPVFMGPAAARVARGTVLVAGPQKLFDAVRPALSAMAETVRYVGERADLASAFKLIGNCYILGIGALVSDVFAIGRGAGIAPADALGMLGMFSTNAILEGRGRKMAQGDFSASFELTMARKDIRLMMETAGEYPLSMLPSLAARMDDVIADGLGAEDYSVIAKSIVE